MMLGFTDEVSPIINYIPHHRNFVVFHFKILIISISPLNFFINISQWTNWMLVSEKFAPNLKQRLVPPDYLDRIFSLIRGVMIIFLLQVVIMVLWVALTPRQVCPYSQGDINTKLVIILAQETQCAFLLKEDFPRILLLIYKVCGRWKFYKTTCSSFWKQSLPQFEHVKYSFWTFEFIRELQL